MELEDAIEEINNTLLEKYEEKEAMFGSDLFRKLEKYILLEVTDSRWRENLRTLDQLKEGIHLRAYGQANPLVQYQLLSSEIYEEMLETIKEEVTSFLFKIRIKTREEEEIEMRHHRNERLNYIHAKPQGEDEKLEPRKSNKTGRNEECPCGSGRKYKNCCGR